MRLHRFYVKPDVELKHDFWLHDERLINQWRKVLRFQTGQELVLFDGVQHERLYRLLDLNEREAHLEQVTDFVRKLPAREVYLFWSLLKKDNNEWVLQKCTELGVSHFIPLLAARCVRAALTQNSMERWRKIIIEAAEQCGRSDIPAIREPMNVETALKDYQHKLQLLVCDQSEGSELSALDSKLSTGVLIGPEGGWSDAEKALFQQQSTSHLNLHDFTLRAETACVMAVTKIQN
jgi:16S rRNA (uracil1498-N3)-methyltransferase